MVKHSGLTIKLWDASDVLVRIVKVFIAWVSKPLVPQWLFSLRSDGMDRDSFVNDELETSEVDPFQLGRHGSKRIIELLVFCSFDDGNFGIDCMFADINKRSILCLSEIK